MNTAYSSLPKFSLHGANVEFLCKIHAAKYVTARDARGYESQQDKIAPAGLADEAKIWDYSRNAISKCEAKNAPSQFHTYYRKNAIAVGCRAIGLSTVRGEHTRFYISQSLLNVMQLAKSHDLLIPRFYAFFHLHVVTVWCVSCMNHISISIIDFWILY